MDERSVFDGPVPADLSINHDKYLYDETNNEWFSSIRGAFLAVTSGVIPITWRLRHNGIVCGRAAGDHAIMSSTKTLTLMARGLDTSSPLNEQSESIFGTIEIVSSTLQDEYEALRYFRKFADQQVSFTDCISFAIMKRDRISTAFTFDRHFLDAGFKVIGLK